MPALVRHPHAALLEPTQLLLQLANKHSKYQLLQAIQKPCRPWSDIRMLLCWNLHSSCFNWQINTANISYCRPSRNHAGPGPTSTCCSAGTYTAPASTQQMLLQAIHAGPGPKHAATGISVIAGHPETMPALVRHPHAALLEPTQLLLQLANKPANISYCRPSRNHAGPGPTSACCSAGTYTAPASTGK